MSASRSSIKSREIGALIDLVSPSARKVHQIYAMSMVNC